MPLTVTVCLNEKSWVKLVLRGWLPIFNSLQEKNKGAALELATLLLSMPTPAGVQQQTKGLLASLHTSRTAYHNHKVKNKSHSSKIAFCKHTVGLETNKVPVCFLLMCFYEVFVLVFPCFICVGHFCREAAPCKYNWPDDPEGLHVAYPIYIFSKGRICRCLFFYITLFMKS